MSIEPTKEDCIEQAKNTKNWQQFKNSGKDSQGRTVLRIPEGDINKYLAAPDMYEALKELRHMLEPKLGNGISLDELAAIDAAIAKAEGK